MVLNRISSTLSYAAFFFRIGCTWFILFVCCKFVTFSFSFICVVSSTLFVHCPFQLWCFRVGFTSFLSVVLWKSMSFKSLIRDTSKFNAVCSLLLNGQNEHVFLLVYSETAKVRGNFLNFQFYTFSCDIN